MIEIVLSFFAVIGITLLTVRIFDTIFYHKVHVRLPLIVDLRGKTEEEAIEIFELVASVRQRCSGRAAISDLIVLIERGGAIRRDTAYHYIKIFDLIGTVYSDGQESWKQEF